jgi:hypothetical protein
MPSMNNLIPPPELKAELERLATIIFKPAGSLQSTAVFSGDGTYSAARSLTSAPRSSGVALRFKLRDDTLSVRQDSNVSFGRSGV